MFVADNLDDWEGYFDESSYGEFPAESIHVVGFDFSTQPLPLCKAEAWFEVPLKDDVPLISAWEAFSAETTEDFDQDSFDEWASDGGGWYTGSISWGTLMHILQRMMAGILELVDLSQPNIQGA